MFSGVLKTINKGINRLMKNQTKYKINNATYIEDKLLAEGGFGYVYLVEEENTGEKFALKKLNVQDNAQLSLIKNEINYWKKVNNHPNIVKMLAYELNRDLNCVFILMELCNDGTLLEYINSRDNSIDETEALSIIKDIACGIGHMHKQSPPIAHRDVKIENVLKFIDLGSKLPSYKLCDFGSACIDILEPKKESKSTILENFSNFEKTTTFFYRPPEMCDPYCKFTINEKVDIWMLGCVLYTILFKRHPFQDAQKLTIINVHYFIPDDREKYSDKIIDLIRLMLTPNPRDRPTVDEIIDVILNWEEIKTINLSKGAKEIKEKQDEKRDLDRGKSTKGDWLVDFSIGTKNVENLVSSEAVENTFGFEFCEDRKENKSDKCNNQYNHQIQQNIHDFFK